MMEGGDRLPRLPVDHHLEPFLLSRLERGARRVDQLLRHLERLDLVLPHRPAAILPPQAEDERIPSRWQSAEIEVERLGASRAGLPARGSRAKEQKETEPAHWSRASPSCAGRSGAARGTDRCSHANPSRPGWASRSPTTPDRRAPEVAESTPRVGVAVSRRDRATPSGDVAE